jgi:UDP:flavonoid glycosyltransferase YjiC (YdhE family)
MQISQTPRSTNLLADGAGHTFFVDWGHVLPLLKIAIAAKNAGHHVRCYIPDAARGFADRSQIPVFPLMRQAARGHEVLSALASRSIFFLNYSGYSHTNLFVYPEMIRTGLAEVDGVLADIQVFAPDVVVADSHVLSPLYEMIAGSCDAPIVRHNPSGTLAGKYRPFLRIYGDTGASRLTMRSTEFSGSVFQFFFRPAFYLRHLPVWLEARAIKKILRDRVGTVRGPQKVWSLTTGLTWIEQHLLGHVEPDPQDSRRADLPPLPSLPEAIPPELDAWLLSSQEPVVYISFGSILRLPDRAYLAIIESLERFSCRVIWSTPVGEAGPLAKLAANPRFYFARYVPQAQLLKRPELSCFITHAGASSVQEALIGGTPVLSVPLHADNGFISWLVSRLKVGRRVWKGRLGERDFADTLESILRDRSFKKRAEDVAHRLRHAGAQDQVVGFLERVESEGRAQPRATSRASSSSSRTGSMSTGAITTPAMG